LIAAWASEEAQPFSGWDFGHVRRRISEDKPPWSYEDLARGVLQGAHTAVDLGTGGGEVLAKLADTFPDRMVATEAYPPNWIVARDRLAPAGASVVAYAADETSSVLPFRDATSPAESYGSGRYLFDTIKGSDFLHAPGTSGLERIVLDFNYAYNPSCAYNDKWVCPLAPLENRLSVPIRAGEMNFKH